MDFSKVENGYLRPRKPIERVITIAKWMPTILKNGNLLAIFIAIPSLVLTIKINICSGLQVPENFGKGGSRFSYSIRQRAVPLKTHRTCAKHELAEGRHTSMAAKKGTNYNESEIKAQLLSKINKDNYKQKVVDEMAANKNVIVLRLPPYHCELNPIELIWAQLKSYVGRNNKTFKMAEVKELLKEGLSKIGTASWTKCIEHVIKEENKMMQLDGLIDSATDSERFIIHVSDDDSNSSDSSDYGSDE